MIEDREDELEDIEEEEKKEPKRKNWWESLPPVVLIGGGFLIFLALRSVMSNKEGSNSYVLLIIMVLAILYSMSKGMPGSQKIVSPKEAMLLVEREIRLKIKWQYWPLGSKFEIQPNLKIMHRNGGGMYYNIGFMIYEPYTHLPKPWLASVMMKGEEKGFVTMEEVPKKYTGREMRQERSILPDWVKMSRKDPVIMDLYKKWGRF